MHPEWARAVRNQCAEHQIRFFFKQWGSWSPDSALANAEWTNAAYFESPSSKPIFPKEMERGERQTIRCNTADGLFLFHAAKGKTGNLLDMKQHHDHPFGKRIPQKETAEPLTTTEKKQLKQHEQVIRLGLQNFVAVGTALMEIRNGRLYRETHATFEEYVRSVFSLSRPHAYNLMDGAQVMRDLSSIEDIPLPTNEAQARELKYFKTPQERAEKWREVVATLGNQPLTAKSIRAAVRPTEPGKPREWTINDFRACILKLEAFVERIGVGENGSAVIGLLKQLVEKSEAGRSEHDPEAVQ